MKLGETLFGVTVWAVLPGRTPGQQTGLAHLTWEGPGHAVRLHSGGVSDGRMEHYGTGTGAVSGPCDTVAEADKAADRYLASLAQTMPSGTSHRPGAARPPDPPLPTTAAEASGATMVLAAEHPEDETARVPAEYGTPEKQLEYALREAFRVRRAAYADAYRQLDEAGTGPAARLRHDVVYAAATARWAAEAAAAVARYARAIGAAPPAGGSDAGDDTSPYNQGWSNGSRMHPAGITSRRGDYDDGQWREYTAGYAQGARYHARASVWYAEAVRGQAHRTLAGPAGPFPRAGSAGPRAVTAQDTPGAAPGRPAVAAPAGRQHVTAGPLPAPRRSRRSAGSTPSAGRQARPGSRQ